MSITRTVLITRIMTVADFGAALFPAIIGGVLLAVYSGGYYWLYALSNGDGFSVLLGANMLFHVGLVFGVARFWSSRFRFAWFRSLLGRGVRRERIPALLRWRRVRMALMVVALVVTGTVPGAPVGLWVGYHLVWTSITQADILHPHERRENRFVIIAVAVAMFAAVALLSPSHVPWLAVLDESAV